MIHCRLVGFVQVALLCLSQILPVDNLSGGTIFLLVYFSDHLVTVTYLLLPEVEK